MDVRAEFQKGLVIPAHPLALRADRKLDERRQRALTRYYVSSGVGGIAVGVHTTQFGIRKAGLLEPVLVLAAEETTQKDMLRIAGICGCTNQAEKEARLAVEAGYHAGLLSLGGMSDASIPELISHSRAIADIIPVVGFYLQPSVGGRPLPYPFWRAFAEIPNVVAIKMAPFNRYQTLDVIRGVIDSRRVKEIALYTGNDDNILLDLLTEFHFGGDRVRIVGGLLGHWAVWTSRAVQQLAAVRATEAVPPSVLTLAAQITDANAALFDVANSFRGCIAGLHEILRRQGLLEGRWCLDPEEDLSPGQMEEIDRVCFAYPHLQDDSFVRENLDGWLR